MVRLRGVETSYVAVHLSSLIISCLSESQMTCMTHARRRRAAREWNQDLRCRFDSPSRACDCRPCGSRRYPAGDISRRLSPREPPPPDVTRCGWLASGLGLMGRIGSVVPVSDSFQIFALRMLLRSASCTWGGLSTG